MKIFILILLLAVPVLADSWTEVAGLPIGRAYSAASTYSNKIYSVSGLDTAGNYTTNVYAYDGATWSEVAGLPMAIAYHTSVAYDGELFVLCGRDVSMIKHIAYSYTGTDWKSLTGPLFLFIASPASANYNNKLYIMGGDYYGAAKSSVFVYSDLRWSQLINFPAYRTASVASVLGNRLYIIGGNNGNVFDSYNPAPHFTARNVYQFDGTNWTEVTELPMPRDYATACTLNDKIYVIGGRDTTTTIDTIKSTVFVYNGTNWSSVASLPKARMALSSAVLNGKIYAIGGSDGVNNYTNVYEYTP